MGKKKQAGKAGAKGRAAGVRDGAKARTTPAEAPPAKIAVRDRVKGLRRVKASDIVPHPKNWRTHDTAQRAALQAALHEVGLADALLVRELRGGKLQLIDGHMRREELGDTLVPVLVLDVTADEAEMLIATIDPLAALAGTDKDRLKDLVDGLGPMQSDLASALKLFTGDDVAADPERDKKTVAFLAGDGKKDADREQFSVIVLCKDEAHQAKVYKALAGEGYECKVRVQGRGG